MADAFATMLLPFLWRGKGYPVARLRFSLAHDLVEHKQPGVDGAYVEDTGIAPVRVRATIPFSNLIVKGESETWASGDLYPTAFREFIEDFRDPRAGILQHPEFGGMLCRPDDLEFELNADARSGAIIEASWVQTLDDTVETVVEPAYVNLDALAITFDLQQTDLRALVPQLPEYETTFEDLARIVQAVGDQAALTSKRAAGRIDQIAYRIDAIQRSVDGARSALTWPATQIIERLRAASESVRQRLLTENRDIVLHTTSRDLTLAGLIPELPGATLTDLMRLNRGLLRGPIVPANTVVRYYAPKAA